jgi:hypothetical protein
MRRRLAAPVLLVLLSAAFALDAAATTVQIPASKDNTLYQQASGTLSNGAGSTFFAGTNATSEIRRGLIAFDIEASIPHGARINSAVLTLHMSQSTSGAQSVSLRRVTADWGEGTSDAAGGEGGGAASTTGDATWIHRFFNTTLWSSVGGDFVAGSTASQSVLDTTFYSWNGAGVIADVQDWLDHPSSNFGWVVLGNESLSGTAKRFDSRQNPVTTVRPVLVVDYVREAPASGAVAQSLMGIVLLGLAVVALRRRSATA